RCGSTPADRPQNHSASKEPHSYGPVSQRRLAMRQAPPEHETSTLSRSRQLHLPDILVNCSYILTQLAKNFLEQFSVFAVCRHMPPFPDCVPPCPVIAGDDNLGFRGIRHDGTCSLTGLLSRKSSSSKEVVVSVVCLPCCSECVIHVGL